MQKRKHIYDPIVWRDGIDEPEIDVTDENTCIEWVGSTNCRTAQSESHFQFYLEGRPVFRATAIVWTGCPCGTRHYGIRFEV